MRLVFLLLVSSLLSQNHNHDHGSKSFKIGSFNGEIINNLDNSPVQYATIKLFKSSDSTLVDGTISEEDGYFILKDINPGRYTLQIEHVMYEKFVLKDQLLVPPNMKRNLGILTLNQRVVEIGDINVVDEKPFIQEEIDKKVYNVEDMSIAASGTAEDVLNNLPSVSIDTDGNVSFRGNTSVNIMVDGRMKSSENLDILDAAMIEKIEVIAIPSAKYDPDGTAGIINIITKRNEYVGRSGKVATGYNHYGSKTLAVSTNYLKNDFNIFGNYSIGDRISEGRSSRHIIERDEDQTIYTEIHRRSLFDNDRENQNFKLGMEFYPDDKSIFFCDLRYTDYDKINTEKMLSTETYLETPDDNVIDEILNSKNGHGGFERSLMAGYSIKLDDEGREISIETDSEFDRHSGYQQLIEDDFYTNESEEHDGFNLAIDYTHPFSSRVEDKKNLLEVGFKDKQHGHKTIFDYNNQYDYDFNYARNILALYFDLAYHINPEFGIKFGTRFEKSNRIFTSDSNFGSRNNSSENIFTFLLDQYLGDDAYIYKSYTTIYPSLFFNYDLKQKGNIKFGFGRRVERPGDWSLSPVPHDFMEEDYIRIGNPTLNPEDIFKYEISYSNRLKIGYLTSSIYWSSIEDGFDYNNSYYVDGDDGIEQCDESGETVICPGADETIPDYYVLSYDNLGKTELFGVEFFLMTKPYKWWDFKVGGDISFEQISSKDGQVESDQEGNESSSSFYAMSTFTIKDDLKLDLNSWMWQANITTGKIHPMYSTSLALKKEFQNKYALIFKIDDMFNTGAFSITTVTDFNDRETTMDYEGRRRGRTYSLNFEYRFGDYKENKFERGSHGHDHDGGDMMGY